MSRASVSAVVLSASFLFIAAPCGGSQAPAPQPPPPPPLPPPAITPPARPLPRAASTAPGSCDGILDYGAELRLTGVRVVGRTYPDASTAELDLELDAENTGGARFRSASLLPDLAGAADLGVLPDPAPLPADFGPLEPGATVTSGASLRLRLPAAQEEEFLRRLRGNLLPLRVQADEENVYRENVVIRPWSAVEDRMYYLAAHPSGGFGIPPNADPGPGPFAPSQQFGVTLLETAADDARTALDDFAPGQLFYLVEDPAVHALVNVPGAFRKLRVLSAERRDVPGDNFVLWGATVQVTNDESLPDLFLTASHCTGKQTHVDLPVQASRVASLDGDTVPAKERDGHPQPVRLNKFVVGDGQLTFAGQIGGHVLKPSLQLKIRDYHVELGADFENELSVAAQLRAVFELPEEIRELLHPDPAPVFVPLCFPLPPLAIGPLEDPMSLQLSQLMGMSGFIGGGVQLDFQKTWVDGLSIRCQVGPGVPQQCTSGTYQKATGAGLTPPRIFENSGYELKATTTFRAALFLHDDQCSVGDSLSLEVGAYFRYGVSPAVPSWWHLAAGAEVTGVLDFSAYGIDLSRYPVTATLFEESLPGADAYPVSGAVGTVGQRRSGEDQRWSVALDDTSVPNGVSWARIATLPDGGSLAVATEPVGGRNPLVRLDRAGAVLWVKELSRKPSRIHALADGTALLVGSPAWLARVDASGQLLWSWDASLGRANDPLGRCVLSDAAALARPSGGWDVVAVGHFNTTADACALRIDEDLTLPWTRIYGASGNGAFDAATPTRDGMVAAVGRAEWNYVGFHRVPWIAKLDPSTGDLAWSRSLPMFRQAELFDVVEAEDGTLFASGNASGTILTTGAALVARIGADGSDARHALFFEDAALEASLDGPWTVPFTAEPFVDTAGGDTAYDTFTGIAPAGDGFVVVGATGLGASTAARAARVNRNLGAEWMVVFDTPGGEAFTGVAVADDGILAAGYSESLPMASGAAPENQLWIAKLPFTGRVEFPADVPLTTRYSATGVRDSGSDGAVVPSSGPSLDVAVTAESLLLLSGGGAAASFFATTSPYCTRLLTGTGSRPVDSCSP